MSAIFVETGRTVLDLV